MVEKAREALSEAQRHGIKYLLIVFLSFIAK